ncbi:unnamed protein product, partial [Ixodes persulcatus]
PSGWDGWGPWSPCSRSCGRGLATQSRLCLGRPPRRVGGLTRRCRGPSKRYRLCALQASIHNFVFLDVRQAQCSSFDSVPYGGQRYVWKAIVPEPEDCQLQCRPEGRGFKATLAKVVRDATPCSAGLDEGVCIGGTCKILGCDRLVGSRQRADRCGVCGGNNSGCRTYSGILTHRELSEDYQVLATIPAGATGIVVSALGNRLALRAVEDGRFIVNGNWTWDSAGVYPGAGARFLYRREDSTGAHSLEARGPLLQPVHIMLAYRSPNPGVNYTYSLRQAGDWPASDGPAAVPGRFLRRSRDAPRWVPRESCSRSCGGGKRSRSLAAAFCVRDGVTVPEDECAGSIRPRDSSAEPCNTQPCPGGGVYGSHWKATSDWTPCSVTCGEGFERRDVICVDAKGGALRESACGTGEKPPAFRSCDRGPCDDQWNTGPWGKCSSECGKGLQKRHVTCGDGHRNSSCDPKLRPASEQVCDMPPCAATWLFSEWSQCSRRCVPGVQKRRLVCAAGPKSCDSLERPSSEQRCLEQCTASWYAGPWSQASCSPRCGNGTRQREVLCVGQQGGRWTLVVPEGHCPVAERPASVKPCDAPCPPEWLTSSWSPCSSSCGGTGVQNRQAFCLDTAGRPSQDCRGSSKPSVRRACGLQACPPPRQGDRACRDTKSRCPLVVQARLCSYPVFKEGCCESCRRANSTHGSLGVTP